MIANYTDHAANERTFLAWIRTGLAVVAFGFFLVKLNVLVEAMGGGSLPRLPGEDAGAFVAVGARYVGMAMVAHAARSIAMRLSRFPSPVWSRCFRRRSRSPWRYSASLSRYFEFFRAPFRSES
jgi:uncharacterized membrane protein YidH (DUF202 family)